jgi:hypothetical protein
MNMNPVLSGLFPVRLENCSYVEIKVYFVALYNQFDILNVALDQQHAL